MGFRYNAKYAADILGVTGWVRNEWDGTVTMEAQGLEESIDRLLLKIQSQRWIRVDHISKIDMPPVEESDFRVR